MDQIYDIMCMLCGRAVGQLRGKKLYRDPGAHSMRKDGKRALCGYCGGSLYVLPDDSGILRFGEAASPEQRLRAS